MMNTCRVWKGLGLGLGLGLKICWQIAPKNGTKNGTKRASFYHCRKEGDCEDAVYRISPVAVSLQKGEPGEDAFRRKELHIEWD